MNASLPPVLARALAPMAPPQSEVHRIVAADDLMGQFRALKPRFLVTYCSQCGKRFGPGNAGFSHCHEHAIASETKAIRERHDDEYRTGLDDVDGRHSLDAYDTDAMRVMRGAL